MIKFPANYSLKNPVHDIYLNLSLSLSLYIYIYIYIYMCVCVFWVYGISTFVGYLMPNPFFFKQLSLPQVNGLIVKNISIWSYSV